MGSDNLYGMVLIYIIGSGIGLTIFYLILKNAIKNGIVEANIIIKENINDKTADQDNPDQQ